MKPVDIAFRHKRRRSCRARPLAAELAAIAFLMAAGGAHAEFAGIAGGDYYSGPAGQVTKSAMAVASVGFERGFATVAGLRFDDSLVGPGWGATAGAGWSLGSPSRLLRVIATRFVGDQAYRAWRLKAGPYLAWGGTSLGVSFVRFTGNDGGEATGGLAELEVPVAARWRATIDGSAAEVPDGRTSASGSAGIAWAASPHLTLSASLGVARNGSVASAGPTSGAGGHATRPILGTVLGGGPGSSRDVATTSNTADTSATLLFGIRVPIP